MQSDELCGQTAGALGWRSDDESEPTAPRLAQGTQELAPLVLSAEPVHRDLAHEEVARIVHDFKGPLATIDLEVELLAESGVAKPIIDRILRNVAFLDRLTMDLLDRCTIDAGKLELRRGPVELRAALRRVIERVVPTRDRGRVFLHAVDKVVVEVDDLRIERVVANLVHNALRYAPPGTDIIISLEHEPARARVSVIDAGHGIADADLAHVFDEYRPRSGLASREGTGIGLFLSKQIIAAHGGTLAVESSPGVGTRFYFELPTAS